MPNQTKQSLKTSRFTVIVSFKKRTELQQKDNYYFQIKITIGFKLKRPIFAEI